MVTGRGITPFRPIQYMYGKLEMIPSENSSNDMPPCLRLFGNRFIILNHKQIGIIVEVTRGGNTYKHL